MNDVIKQDDLVTIDGETYFVIVTDDSTGINYGFVNQIDADDNATDIYKIIYKDGSDTKILVDEAGHPTKIKLREQRTGEW